MLKRIIDLVLIGTGSISRPDATSFLVLRGGTDGSDGANLLLYGSSHSTLPGVSVFEGDRIVFRSVSGGPTVVQYQPATVATLPTPTLGGRSFVTDALSPTWGAAVTGGGSVKVPVYSDGASWFVG